MLVERIVNKVINENIDIDKILIVTFTNAAASEMRERILEAIYKKIEENPNNQNLQRQIMLLNKASICTIDSFCLDVIKNNFFEIDISPNFRIGDSSEIEILKYEVLEELFEEKYESEDKDFIKLINTYTTYKDDTLLKNLVLKIYTYIQSNPFPNKWLNEKVEMFNLGNKLDEDFSKTVWGDILLKEFKDEITDNIATLEKTKNDLSKYPELSKFYLIVSDDIEQLNLIKQNIDLWDKTYELTNNLEFKKWPVDRKNNLELKDDAKKVRDLVKKRIKSKLDKILLFNSKEANQDIYDMYPILDKLKNLIFEFESKFKKAKKEKNILDFSDIEHYALDILIKQNEDGKISRTEVAKKYAEKFEEIAIDEYQDSNLVQEYILTSVSKNDNIFMVGDIKQSIYKFRQARPELFLNKYLNYKLKQEKTEGDNLKIQLFKNFRSRKNVLDFTNIIFENIMSSNLGDIEYKQEEFLNLGAQYKENNQEIKTEIDIIDIKQDISEEESEEHEDIERIENVELEAKFVANRIKQLIDSNYEIYDTKKDEFRKIKYKDIVILLRSTKNTASIYEKELINLKLPVFSDTSAEYLDSIEIQTIMSLLKIIDNPLQDIPLVTVLRSNIGGFTDNDLIKIRLSDKYDNFYYTIIKAKLDVDIKLKNKIEVFLNNLDMWRKEQEYLPLDELIWKIYIDTGYYNYVGLMPNGQLRQANLRMLFQRAKQYETSSFNGLFNFIKFIENLKANNGDLGAAKLIGENEDVIRIMSIHKSKGLEFPIVILANTGKQFNLMDLNNNLLLHQDIGIGVKYIDYDKQIEYDTLSKSAIKAKLYDETLSEEMRILYVALTRAKEKLIITGISKDYEKELKDMEELIARYEKINGKINSIVIKKYIKYIDWIKLVYLYDENLKEISTLNVYEKNELLKTLDIKKEEIKINLLDILNNLEEENNEYLNEISNLLDNKYAYKNLVDIPTKTSVTKLKQLETGKVVNKKVYNENSNILPSLKLLNKQEDKKLTSAEKGTLIHLCMQNLNPNKDYVLNDIQEIVNKLECNEIITKNEAENININKVLNFTKSEIWKQLKEAKEVYKEKPFYINIPAKDVYQEDLEEKILVQGIIDLYYIDKNNNVILIDYKTDYVQPDNEQELIVKYKKQLQLYKQALEEALDKKVEKVYIYSVYLDKELEVKL